MTIDDPRPPHRLARLREWMAEQRVDAVVAAGADHVVHLGGYSRYLGGPAAVVVGADARRTLVVAFDEAPAARDVPGVDEVVPYGVHGFGIDLKPVDTLASALAELEQVRAARRLGVVDGLGGVAAHLRGDVVDASAALARIRLVPDEDELPQLLRAYELSWRGQAAVGEAAAAGAAEIEVFTAAQSACQLACGEPIEFVADLVSGPDTSKVGAPPSVPGKRPIEDGDPVIADIVVGAGGYWGDTAETHVVGRNAEVEEARAALLEILARCGAELRPGNTGAHVFTAMQERVLARFPGGELPHHAGHAVSLSAFEDPHMVPSDRTPLESWMLISLEPGVYFPGRYGARVENTFIVTSGGGVELRAAMGAAA